MVRSSWVIFSIGIAFASSACSSSIDVGGNEATSPNPGNGSVAGTDNGHALAAQDAVGDVSNSGVIHSLWMTVSDHANMCASLQRGAEGFANATSLRFDLLSDPPVGDALTIGTGTYAIGGSTPNKPGFSARFVKTDAQCTNAISSGDQDAIAGTLTISEISSSRISGTFDLTFLNGSLHGSVNAARCSPSTARGDKCAP